MLISRSQRNCMGRGIIKSFSRRIYLLCVIILILGVFTSCLGKNITDNSKGQTEKDLVDTTSITQDKDKNSGEFVKLSNILDGDKYEGKFTIRMFNVIMEDANGVTKSGDTYLLCAPDGTTMLIDTGYRETIPQIIEYIKQTGVEKLDYIVITHMHHDHIAGFPAVLDEFPVGKVLSSKYIEPYNAVSRNLISALQKKELEINCLEEGMSFQFGEDIKVEILNPEALEGVEFPEDPASQHSLRNNLSLVLKMTYKNNTFLFTGDIHITSELRLVEKYGEQLKSDVVTAPHHGLNSSSSSIFIETVSPSYTLISNCALKHLSPYQAYKKAGSEVFINAFDGTVLLVSDGENIDVVTEKDEKGD